MSRTVQHLECYYHCNPIISLVGRSQSNGIVERDNQDVLRHLFALCSDERCVDHWSEDTVLPRVQYLLNSSINPITKISPYLMEFGSQRMAFDALPLDLAPELRLTAYVAELDKTLASLAVTSKAWQD